MITRSTAMTAAATPPLLFGDPNAIAQRGPIPDRKIRIKPKRDKKWKRYAPIWQRIEGEWTRLRCKKCRAVSFRVLDTEGIIVHVRCVKEHKGTVLKGFVMEKPEEEE